MSVHPSRGTRPESGNQEVAADRGTSAVAGRRSFGSVLRYLALFTLLAGGGAAIALLALQGHVEKKDPLPKAAAGSQMQAYVPPPPPHQDAQPLTVYGAPSGQTSQSGSDKGGAGAPACPPGQRGCPASKPDPMVLARESPVLIYSRGGSLAGVLPAAQPIAATMAPPPQVERNELQARLSPTVLTATQASQLRDRNLLLAQGAIIECILERAIDSTLPGLTTCSVPRDILSDNGRVVLLEKGTQIVGEYQGGLRQGQRRIFVLWTRAKTPEGVVINLASPASDALGRTGFDGEIDNHFWDRFGAALLLSIVDDATATAGQIAANAANGNGNTTTIQTGGSQSAGKQGASIAVENSVNIPPTLYKNQGEVVAVQLARDLDFSTVYSLELRN